MRFAEKVALVTGGSQGIGFAIAQALARAGARVVVLARDPERLAKAVTELGPGSGSVACDIGDELAPEHAVRAVLDRFGRLDILVNNVGLLVPGSVQEMQPDAVHQMLRTNIGGPALLTQCAAAVMRSGGAVLNISSAATKGPILGAGIYGATKVAIEYLTSVWAAELAPQHIRVNALRVGATNTPQFQAVADQIPGYVDSALASQLVKCIAEPDQQIAPTALHLLDDATGSHITGAVFAVDAGYWPKVAVEATARP